MVCRRRPTTSSARSAITPYGGWKDVPQGVGRAFDWYDRNRRLSDEGRMRAIMHNIISNNGEFVL